MSAGDWRQPSQPQPSNPSHPPSQRPPPPRSPASPFGPPIGAPSELPGGPTRGPLPSPSPVPPPLPPVYQPLRSTRGLGTATIVLMWCATACLFLVAMASRHRVSVVDEYDTGFGSLRDVRDADNLIAGAFFPTFCLVLAIAIVVSIWSLRICENAARSGARTQPGLAAGSWYIPLAWFVLPFILLNQARRGRGSPTALVLWAIFFGLTGLMMGAQRGAVSDIDETLDIGEVTDSLQQQTSTIFAAALCAIGASIAGMRAIRALEALDSTPQR